MVNSSNSGVCPGSSHPCGLRMWATLVADVLEFTRPTYSSIIFGLFPAALMRVGCGIRVGMGSDFGVRKFGSAEFLDYNRSERRGQGLGVSSHYLRQEFPEHDSLIPNP